MIRISFWGFILPFGSTHPSSRLPLPLMSRTNGAHPWLACSSWVASHFFISSQPMTSLLPPPELNQRMLPMNDARNQTMTNATVTGTAIVNGSNSMRVKFGPSQIGGSGTTYPGGESDLVLDPNVSVVKFTDADGSIVKAGGHVRVQGVRNAQGEIVNRITAMP